MFFLRGLCLLLCAAFLANAQTNKEKAPPPGTIHAVIVKGNQLYDQAAILKVLDLRPGATASLTVFQEAQHRLLQTDLFADVSYEFRFSLTKPARYDVTYTVSEFQQVAPLQFEDLGVSEKDLRAYLQAHVPLYNDRIPPTPAVLRRYTEAAQDFVAQTRPSLKVKAFVSSDDPNHLAVLIAPDKPMPRIAGVTVTGNQVIETAVLQRTVNDVAVGQRMSDANVREMLNRSVKPLYAAKGYVAVSFPKIESEKSSENEGYVVHIQIQEGPVFHFGNSAFRGGSFTADDIRAMVHYKKGEVFDLSKAEQLRHDLSDSLRKQGYLDEKVELAQEEDDKNRAVNLSYSIVPGSLYTFQTLNVHGLDIESEPEVRKLWAPKPGKPFNPEYPEFFLKRIRDMGLFDHLGSTKSTFTPDEGTHTVAVDLFFSGSPSNSPKPKEQGIAAPESTTQQGPP
jgi:outer membrane protein insertion porin family